MMVIATYDMVMNLGIGPEKVIRGQEFQPPGTGAGSRKEHAESLIAQGAAVRPDDWQKRKVRTEAGYAWAAEEVARANKVAERARVARLRAEEERRKAREGSA